MKKILIVGSGSYIGESFAKYLQEKYPGQYLTETVGTLHEEWKTVSFAGYDAVFDVAGIAHQKETKENVLFFILFSTFALRNRYFGVTLQPISDELSIRRIWVLVPRFQKFRKPVICRFHCIFAMPRPN